MERTKRSSTIVATTVRWVMQCVRRRRKRDHELWKLAGLDPRAPASPDQHVTVDRYLAVWHRALELVDDPAFPLEAAAAFDVETLGLFGFLAISCATLGEAYARTATVRDLYNVGASWDLDPRGSTLRLVWNGWSVRAPGRDAADTYQVAEMLTVARHLTQKRLVPARVTFTFPRPADPRPFVASFGVMPEFGADHSGLEADLSWLALPVRSGNPRLRDHFEKECRAALEQLGRAPEFTAQARRRIAASMNGERLTLKGLARALAVTERTLQRRLAEEGTTFAELVDEVRREFAERYLARPHLSLGEVSWLIGFDEPSSFFKAFRRWTGKTPRTWRAGG